MNALFVALFYLLIEFECHGRNVTPEVFESHEHTLTRSYSLPGHLSKFIQLVFRVW